MTEAAVECLLESIKNLLLYNASIIAGASWQIELLYNDIRTFRSFLQETMEKRREDDDARELRRLIQNAIFEVEDAIDSFVVQATVSKTRTRMLPRFMSVLVKPPVNLSTICTMVESITKKIEKYRSIEFVSSKSHTEPKPKELRDVSELVGFGEEIKRVIGRVIEETAEPDFIAIIGRPGIGKTALAWAAFCHERVAYEFPTRVWINVSDGITNKHVFLDILKQCTSFTEEMNGKHEVELGAVVAEYLWNRKFLIVVDDVRSIEDWNRIRVALPAHNYLGKVMITSWNEEVGGFVSRFRQDPLKLQPLDLDDSWKLLRSQVFGNRECPPELENIGRLIASQCNGLPLAILFVASALLEVELSSSNATERRSGWTKVCSRVPHRHVNIYYQKLPYHLRSCFLYFGIFPYDYKIPVRRLLQLWIAEGFIVENPRMSLEETAETYLRELIDLNLVDICQIKSNGGIKTCSLQLMQHEFCKIEAGHERENFLQEIKFSSSDGCFNPPISELRMYRRLCISSNILDFLSSKPFCPRVRSFLSFSSDEVPLGSKYSSAIPLAFRLVRVLDVKPIKFAKFSSDMYDLIHLRFLALSTVIGSLPPKFTRFWNLQTLIIHTTSPTLEIKADIWSFPHLRHFITNASATLPDPTKSGRHGETLQTLALTSPQSCTVKILGRAINLKKLGIRGRLSLLFHEISGSFDCLSLLSDLEALKLVNDVYPMSPSQVRLHSLPPAYKFPPNLKSLTLTKTCLDWSEMSKLRLLERLLVLKLKDDAFKGRTWLTEDGGFRRLEALHIESTDLVTWEASARHFPRLGSLKLHNCQQLEEVPIELADIPSFQELELVNSKLATASAIRINEVIMKQRYEEGSTKKFKFSSFPPAKPSYADLVISNCRARISHLERFCQNIASTHEIDLQFPAAPPLPWSADQFIPSTSVADDANKGKEKEPEKSVPTSMIGHPSFILT